ncbi:MAG: hypothetical protein Q8K72_11400 [Acidimicrobiales bacterium]|nr:hypothetical protein [Acidimicrobiales bacterium]
MPTPLQRQLDGCDAVAADVLANWGTPAFSATAGDLCERSWGRSWDLQNDPPTGRKVLVIPEMEGMAEQNPVPQVDTWGFGVRLLVIERYTGTEAEPPRAWVDALALWCDGQYQRLQNENRADATGGAVLLNDLEPVEGCEILYTYDPDLIAYEKVFSCCYRLVFDDTRFDPPA